MKRGTPEHPKTAELMDLLKISLYSAVGILEMLWHMTAKYTKRGNIGRFSDFQIARFVGWSAGPATLIDALVRSGWLDKDAQYRLLVHDWKDHCDNSVKKALKRSKVDFIASIRNGLDMSSRCLDMELPPEPEPEPSLSLPEPGPRPARELAAAAAEKENSKILQERGLSEKQAKHWVAVTHPDDLTVILEFHSRLIDSGKAKSTLGCLKSLLMNPEKWDLERGSDGRLRLPPLEIPPSKRRETPEQRLARLTGEIGREH